MSSLADRYYYGLSHGPLGLTSNPEAAGIEKVQREKRIEGILHETKTNLEQVREAIIDSGSSQTAILAASIQQQTEEITYAIAMGTRLTVEAISLSTEAICHRLDGLEIQLELTNATLNDIQNCLRENRRNETRQLLSQALRHFEHDQLDKAENRLQEALNFDSTDYGALMLYGHVLIGKGEWENAVECFRDAERLPVDLTFEDTLRAKRSLARLYYAHEDFEEAASVQKEAQTRGLSDSLKNLYLLGQYSSLARDHEEARRALNELIDKEPGYFATALSDPHFKNFREYAPEFFEDLTRKVCSELENEAQKFCSTSAALDFHTKEARTALGEILSLYERLTDGVYERSYSDLRKALAALRSLTSCLSNVLPSLEEQQRKLDSEVLATKRKPGAEDFFFDRWIKKKFTKPPTVKTYWGLTYWSGVVLSYGLAALGFLLGIVTFDVGRIGSAIVFLASSWFGFAWPFALATGVFGFLSSALGIIKLGFFETAILGGLALVYLTPFVVPVPIISRVRLVQSRDEFHGNSRKRIRELERDVSRKQQEVHRLDALVSSAVSGRSEGRYPSPPQIHDEPKIFSEELEIGGIYEGEVVSTTNFGAFVALRGMVKEGMVHISELADHRVARVKDVVIIGDTVTVRCIDIDERGRVKLSMRQV